MSRYKLLFTVLSIFFIYLPHAQAETLEISRVDGSQITLIIDRQDVSVKVPILVAIDGSLCTPSSISNFVSGFKDGAIEGNPFALLVVEKPSPTIPPLSENGSYIIDSEFHCSEEFKKYYTLEQRILDHLQAIAHLRSHAEWWDGNLLIWGFSDGGHIAARVGAFSPETIGMVLVGTGGGTSMAQELSEMMCSDHETPDKCRDDFNIQAEEMRINPTYSQSWLGDANTYAVWASRLDAIEMYVLQDANFPIRLVHGSEDNSVPVNAARVMAEKLSFPNGTVTYQEIEGMGHSLGSRLPPEQGTTLKLELLNWLLNTTK